MQTVLFLLCTFLTKLIVFVRVICYHHKNTPLAIFFGKHYHGFMNTNDQLLDYLNLFPYQASFYDKTGKLIYTNGKSDGSIFPSIEEQDLADWIIDAVQTNSSHQLHLQVPVDAFDRIMMQSYQALFEGELFKGVYAYVQDIKPLLSSYLQESGQAIVGWSDVTSGASIANDTLDDY